MKISEKWLREWANPSITTDELVARLTMTGLEIDSVTPVAAQFSGVVVGEIMSLTAHPDADKLRVCQVAGHPSGVLQVVCGAANARQGLKIPFALVGACLPPKEEGRLPFQIKSAKLRGVESQGMLCSAAELGMESTLDGLMELPADAQPGQDIRSYLDLDDSVLEVNLTPNRGDCLSVRGLAREIAVLTGVVVTAPAIPAVKASIADVLPIELRAALQCPRYVGRVIRNIKTGSTSPLWLQEKLRRSGIRSIGPVVDVTNYVLLELGQPMHAFDFNKLDEKINVRVSESAESVSLLNDQEIVLKEGTLLISDRQGPLAMAGIMGGSRSAVSAATENLFLEAAYFDPLALAGKARAYGLHTDSSHRFERGVDYNLPLLAMERATALLLEIVGGEAGPVTIKENTSHLPSIADIPLRPARVKQYLGLTLSAADIQKLLQGLGVELVDFKDNLMLFRPPSWRFDLRIEVDLLEEIARVYGYNNLPVSSFQAQLNLAPLSESSVSADAVKSRLTALGYREVVTYSFVDPALQALLQSGPGAQIEVQNPISAEMGVMRRSLLPGLLSTASYNLNRQQSRIRIFESGLTFNAVAQKYQQEEALGLLLSGSRYPENWFNNKSELIDFYDIKGDVEALFSQADQRLAPDFRPTSNQALHPGQSADIYLENRLVGWIGALHPGLLSQTGLSQPVFVAQIAGYALKKARIPVFEEVSRFPELRRDLAVLVARDLPVQRLCDTIKSVTDSYLTNLKVFDVYSGEGIDPQRKSVALGLTFQAKSRTLTDSEINENVDRVIKALQLHFQAELRS